MAVRVVLPLQTEGSVWIVGAPSLAATNVIRGDELLVAPLASVSKAVTKPENIGRMEPNARGSARGLIEEWRRLLDGPTDRMLAAYTSRSEHGRDLRQVAPFAGLLTDAERKVVLDAWQADRRSRSSGAVA